jgi:hypothetical protein
MRPGEEGNSSFFAWYSNDPSLALVLDDQRKGLQISWLPISINEKGLTLLKFLALLEGVVLLFKISLWDTARNAILYPDCRLAQASRPAAFAANFRIRIFFHSFQNADGVRNLLWIV